MKKILLILAVVIVASCKTENIYLTVFPTKRVTETTDTIYVVPNSSDMNKKDLELFQKAIKDKGHVLFQAEEYKYGDLVIPFAAEILGVPIEKQICRVVQIRKEIGQFGSDLFFVRHADGDLFVWENQHFYKVKEKYIRQIETVYNQYDAIEIDDDKPEVGYCYSGNKEFIKGFIIPSPYPADHITPMKSVQAGIKEKIQEIINS